MAGWDAAQAARDHLDRMDREADLPPWPDERALTRQELVEERETVERERRKRAGEGWW